MYPYRTITPWSTALLNRSPVAAVRPVQRLRRRQYTTEHRPVDPINPAHISRSTDYRYNDASQLQNIDPDPPPTTPPRLVRAQLLSHLRPRLLDALRPCQVDDVELRRRHSFLLFVRGGADGLEAQGADSVRAAAVSVHVRARRRPAERAALQQTAEGLRAVNLRCIAEG